MTVKNSKTSDKLRVMRPVTLQDLLERARDGRSYSEMARRCGLPVMTIHRTHNREGALPSQSTLAAMAMGYRIPLEELALAAYGAYYEEVENGASVGSPAALVPA